MAVPDNQGLGRRLGEDFKRILPLIKALGHAEVRAFLETGAVEVGGVTLRGSDLQVGVGGGEAGVCRPPGARRLLGCGRRLGGGGAALHPFPLSYLPACLPVPARLPAQVKREVRAELAGRYEAAVSPGGDLLVAVDVVQVGG